ncbi:RagB/SusD family nutrient uptake outer membrane protein [Sphingobacterium phlebotomi]|uniref:RagB/SusD family nutrient uptake outer membrane protein n=2 Tax=Sphingobacterium phlebotomi TaxID=2605433 RepID=A0A5D4HA32_9SPHI|nr:RagB/SusD family nutrient uptake outer membrane protein [Sphingobacterium phlebotomi]
MLFFNPLIPKTMKKFHHNIYYCFVLLTVLQLSACSRTFLEVKPQKQQVVVETLQDITALLDHANVMNRTDYSRLISDGDFYYTDAKVASIPEVQRNLYLWNVTIDPTNLHTASWDLPYQQIMYANIAMETLEEMSRGNDNRASWEELYGRARFFRAWAHYQLLQDFAEGYDNRRNDQLGIPILTKSTYPQSIERASIEDVYNFILTDLEESVLHLPERSSIKTRPSKQSGYALMARVYLNLGDFEAALLHVQYALELDKTLLDYNMLSLTDPLPFAKFNFLSHPEIIFFTSSNVPLVAIAGIEGAEQVYSRYSDDDLRKKVFFNDERLYTGTYSGASSYHFTGLAIDELYLIQAESLIRLDRLEEGINVMKELLSNRFVYNDVTVDIPDRMEELLYWILEERQKELVGRGTRWTDLKRINRDSETQVDLTRVYNGEQYELPANSSRYTFTIPLDEIQISGIEQNVRK